MSVLSKIIPSLTDIFRPYESEDTVYNFQNYYGEIVLSDCVWKSCYRRKKFGLYEKFVVNSGCVKYFHRFNDRDDVFHCQKYFSCFEFIICQVSENSTQIFRRSKQPVSNPVYNVNIVNAKNLHS